MALLINERHFSWSTSIILDNNNEVLIDVYFTACMTWPADCISIAVLVMNIFTQYYHASWFPLGDSLPIILMRPLVQISIVFSV